MTNFTNPPFYKWGIGVTSAVKSARKTAPPQKKSAVTRRVTGEAAALGAGPLLMQSASAERTAGLSPRPSTLFARQDSEQKSAKVCQHYRLDRPAPRFL